MKSTNQKFFTSIIFFLFLVYNNSANAQFWTEDFVPVRAVDLLGREIDLPIKNQLIILVDKQGRTKKQVVLYE